MKRARWLEAKSSSSIRTIAARIKGSLFEPSLSDGFLLRRVRDQILEAVYVEKLQYQEQINDPFGNQETHERTIYRTLEFALSNSLPNLALVDPPRSLQSFISRLSEITSFTLSISAIAVHPIDWLDQIERITESRASIELLQVGEIDLREGVRARIVATGYGDNRKAMGELLRNRKHTIEKLVARLPATSASKSAKICLTRNATAQWSNASSEFFQTLNSALARAVAS